MSNTEPALSLADAQDKIATEAKAPRVSEKSIKDKIKLVEYLRPNSNVFLTICVITMQNGFMVTGVSAPASIENYNSDIGERYAYENAFKQLWQLEGYLLKEHLSVRAAEDRGG